MTSQELSSTGFLSCLLFKSASYEPLFASFKSQVFASELPVFDVAVVKQSDAVAPTNWTK
jgi:hypothetical protein